MIRFRVFMWTCAAGLVSACAGQPAAPIAPPPAEIGGPDDLRVGPEPTASPDDVEIAPKSSGGGDGEVAAVRRGALLEAAQGYGSGMGYARRGWEIGKILERRSTQLDRAFDFSRVVSEAPVKAGFVVPPVVSRGFDAFDGDAEGRTVSVAGEYLTIVAPGRLRPVQPTWRDYLLFVPAPPEEPPRSLLPRDRTEMRMFKEWFDEGWEAGVELADREISSRLDRLRRDYEGMLEYRRLVSLGMMDRMVLRKADLGVTGGGGGMRIGSRTVGIISDAEFDADPRRWSVVAVSERDRLTVAAGGFPRVGTGGGPAE